VDEAGEEGVCFVVAQGVLCGPVGVVFGQPGEVVVPQVDASAKEMRQERVAVVECQDIGGFENPRF
jgi:hypothetical protein